MNIKSIIDKYQKVNIKEYPNECISKPLISICVQTYQHVSYIEKCIKGILEQNIEYSYEILLGDDGSTDGTRELCIEYAKKYQSKIRLLLHNRENNIKINGHPSGRFNLLYNLYIARGKYIALCEGDDYWTDPEKLQKQIMYMEEHEQCTFCFHDAWVLDAEKNEKTVLLTASDPNNKDLIKKADKKYHVGEIALLNSIPTASFVFRKSILDDLPSWYGSFIVGDNPLKLLATSRGYAYFIDQPMSVYRINVKNSAMYKWRNKYNRIEDRVKYMKNHMTIFETFNDYTDYQYSEYFEKALDRLRFNIYYLQGDLKKIKDKRYQEYYKRLGILDKIKMLIRKFVEV